MNKFKTLLALTVLTLAPMAQAEFLLRDVGVIGLMSHDVFAWDHRVEKNTENAPVYTVTMELVNFYRDQLARTQDPVQSRKLTVIHFHQQIRASYARAFGMDFPTQGLDEMTNNNEKKFAFLLVLK